MPRIGFHASHEQFPPSELLALVQEAERAGFTASMCSDHFLPWSEAQGHSGYAWSWLGAAGAVTKLPLKVVTAPGYRQHPAIVAQACATIAEMFPGRFDVVLGSGQLLNEHVVGAAWPDKAERNARLAECVDVMRRLWAGETVTHRGRVVVEQAKLYTRPATPPRAYGAALTPATARLVGGWADGLATVCGPRADVAAVLAAFRAGGGAGKPALLKVHVQVGDDLAAARADAFAQWRTNLFPSPLSTDLRLPADYEQLASTIGPDRLTDRVLVATSPAAHVEHLRAWLDMGFDELVVHHVGRDQRAFLRVYGDDVLPKL